MKNTDKNIALIAINIFAKNKTLPDKPESISEKEYFFFLTSISQETIQIEKIKNMHQNTIKPENNPASIEKNSLFVIYSGIKL